MPKQKSQAYNEYMANKNLQNTDDEDMIVDDNIRYSGGRYNGLEGSGYMPLDYDDNSRRGGGGRNRNRSKGKNKGKGKNRDRGNRYDNNRSNSGSRRKYDRNQNIQNQNQMFFNDNESDWYDYMDNYEASGNYPGIGDEWKEHIGTLDDGITLGFEIDGLSEQVLDRGQNQQNQGSNLGEENMENEGKNSNNYLNPSENSNQNNNNPYQSNEYYPIPDQSSSSTDEINKINIKNKSPTYNFDNKVTDPTNNYYPTRIDNTNYNFNSNSNNSKNSLENFFQNFIDGPNSLLYLAVATLGSFMFLLCIIFLCRKQCLGYRRAKVEEEEEFY